MFICKSISNYSSLTTKWLHRKSYSSYYFWLSCIIVKYNMDYNSKLTVAASIPTQQCGTLSGRWSSEATLCGWPFSEWIRPKFSGTCPCPPSKTFASKLHFMASLIHESLFCYSCLLLMIKRLKYGNWFIIQTYSSCINSLIIIQINEIKTSKNQWIDFWSRYGELLIAHQFEVSAKSRPQALNNSIDYLTWLCHLKSLIFRFFVRSRTTLFHWFIIQLPENSKTIRQLNRMLTETW